MLSCIILVLAGAALSAAQAASTTASPTGPVVSLFLPDTDSQKLVASVVGSAESMTTYVITCPEGTDASDCGYSEPVTITEGASSLLYSQSGSDFTASVDCTLTGSTAGVCIESFGGSAANFPGLSTTSLEKSDITFFPVTVTAGLAGSGSGSGTGAVPTTATVSETGAAASSMQLSDTAQATSSSASASAGATTSSTASSGGAASGKGRTLVGLGLFGLGLVCFW